MAKKFLKIGIGALIAVPVLTGAGLLIGALTSQGFRIMAAPDLKIVDSHYEGEDLIVTIDQTKGQGYWIQDLSVEISGSPLSLNEHWFIIETSQDASEVTIKIIGKYLKDGTLYIGGFPLNEAEAEVVDVANQISFVQLADESVKQCVDGKATFKFRACKENGDPWIPDGKTVLTIDPKNASVQEGEVAAKVAKISHVSNGTIFPVKILTSGVIDVADDGTFDLEFSFSNVIDMEIIDPAYGDNALLHGIDFNAYFNDEATGQDYFFTPNCDMTNNPLTLIYTDLTARSSSSVLDVADGYLKAINVDALNTEMTNNEYLDTLYVSENVTTIVGGAMTNLASLPAEYQARLTKLDISRASDLVTVETGAFDGFSKITNDIELPLSTTEYQPQIFGNPANGTPEMEGFIINGAGSTFHPCCLEGSKVKSISVAPKAKQCKVIAGAFDGCYELKAVHLTRGIYTQLGQMGEKGIFPNCPNLSIIDLRDVDLIETKLNWDGIFENMSKDARGDVYTYAPYGMSPDSEEYKNKYGEILKKLQELGLKTENWTLHLLASPGSTK